MSSVRITETDSGVHVNFQEFFGRPMEQWENFSLVKKKSYRNIKERIAEACQFVAERDSDFVTNLAKVRWLIHDCEDLGPAGLAEEVQGLITPSVFTIINDHIEEVYEESLDEREADAPRNDELQFRDVHAKAVIKASMAMKVVIPVIGEYLGYHPDVTDNNALIYQCVFPFFRRFAGANEDIGNKLSKLVESRVMATHYSDRVIWTYLRNVGLDANIMKQQLLRKLVVDIVPKLEHHRGVISYFHTTLKNQLRYQFQAKFPYSFKPVSPTGVDSEDSNPFERLEQAFQHDEGAGVINDVNIESVIRKHRTSSSRVIQPEEIDYYTQKMVVNPVQMQIIFLFFQKDIGRYDHLYAINKLDYVILALLLQDHLTQNGFVALPQLLMGIPVGDVVEKENFAGRRFAMEVAKSAEFERLHEKKFTALSQKFGDSNVITKMIATATRNKFTELTPYGHEVPEVNEELELRQEVVASEYLRFVNMLA